MLQNITPERTHSHSSGEAVGPSQARVQPWVGLPLPILLQKLESRIYPYRPQDSLLPVHLSVCLSVCLSVPLSLR